MKLKAIITIIALISVAAGINAQQNIPDNEAATVIVEMTTGTIIEGQINEWKMGEFIDLKTSWSESLVLPSSSIKKVIQQSTMGIAVLNSYRFRESGIYYSGKMQFITGNDGQRAREVNGFGVSISGGYRFNRLVGVGIGVGYDRFIWGTAENLIPIFIEYTSYFSPKNTTLFANLQTGYSIAFKDDDYLLTEAKGGFMIYPAFGIRLGGGENQVTFDVGYKFQKAEFTYRESWSPTVAEQRLTYKRLTMRFGILL